MLLITFAIFFAQNGRGDTTAGDAISSSEFSSAMPLP
jgi:hypothetical protein